MTYLSPARRQGPCIVWREAPLSRAEKSIDKYVEIGQNISNNYMLLDVLLYNTGIYLDEYTA